MVFRLTEDLPCVQLSGVVAKEHSNAQGLTMAG
jgi:hypothetical protein